MSRRSVLADTLARLEVERLLPMFGRPPDDQGPLADLTPEQQATNRRILLAGVEDFDQGDE